MKNELLNYFNLFLIDLNSFFKVIIYKITKITSLIIDK